MKKREKIYLFNKKLSRKLLNTLREEVTKVINEEMIKVLKGEISLEEFKNEITPFNEK